MGVCLDAGERTGIKLTDMHRSWFPRFTRDPNERVPSADELEEIRRKVADAVLQDLQEDAILEDTRTDLLVLYLRRGYRGPLPKLY